MKRIAFIILLIILISITGPPCSASGCIGHISIPSINCTFDLSWFYSDASDHQHIAMLYKTYGCQTVGNHYASASSTGGLWKLENLTVGDVAYFDYMTGDGTETIHHSGKYICYAIFLADVENSLFTHNGKEVKPFSETDLICTTCAGSDSTRNYVCFFEKVY